MRQVDRTKTQTFLNMMLKFFHSYIFYFWGRHYQFLAAMSSSSSDNVTPVFCLFVRVLFLILRLPAY